MTGRACEIVEEDREGLRERRGMTGRSEKTGLTSIF